MRGFGHPGIKTNSRMLAQVLAGQNSNNGSTAGGVGHVLQQALLGYMMGKDGRDQTEASQAMLRGMSAKPWTPPDAQIAQGPSGTPQGDMMIDRSEAMSNASKFPTGGHEGGLTALAGLGGNEHAGRLTQQLLMGKLDADARKAERDSELVTAFDPEKNAPVFHRRGDIRPGMMAEAPDTPAAAAEYQFAKNDGFRGSFADFLAFKGRVGASPKEQPSNVREWQFFSQLPPDHQRQYLTMRRANPSLNLGDVFAQPDPLEPGRIAGQFPVGIAPDREVGDGRVLTLPAVPGEGRATGAPMQPSPQPPMQPPAPMPEMMGGVPAARPAPAAQPAVDVQELPPSREERREEEERQRQAGERQQMAATQAGIVTQDIDRLVSALDEDPTIPLTGILGVGGSFIPGTPQHDFSRTLDTVRANIGFDKLQAMRDASPTGGALGQVSEFENRLLQATAGNVEQSQSVEQLRRNLLRVREIYSRIIHQGIPEDEARQMLTEMQGGAPTMGAPTTGAPVEYDFVPGRGLVPRGQ